MTKVLMVAGNDSVPVRGLPCPIFPEIEKLPDQVRHAAALGTTVLITGESGTGKTRLARVIHELSPLQGKPFVRVDCAAPGSALVESELFGHVRGAFIGAEHDRVGKLGQVAGGTVLLDEVNALPLLSQAKVQRALRERIFQPVGSDVKIPLQARIIALSSVPLREEAAAAGFRPDLASELGVLEFRLPPLRERRQAIVPLLRRFFAEFRERLRGELTAIAPEVLATLEAYDWPGNIRELRNVIERSVQIAQGRTIELDDTPERIRGRSLRCAT